MIRVRVFLSWLISLVVDFGQLFLHSIGSIIVMSISKSM